MRTIILSALIFVTFSFISIAQDWLPLEVWNKAHFTQDNKYRMDMSSWLYSFSFFTFQISDSTTINGNKYYYSFSFFNFPNATPIRYDQDSCRIYLNKNGTEYLYMDFLLPDGSVFSQIQPNNTFRPVMIVSSSVIVLGDTVNLKGFFRETTYPDRYKKGWYYFAPGMGVVKQIEESDWWLVELISFDLIEYRYFNDLGEIIHKKHSNSANIQFNPITQLNFGENLQQEFLITHPFSVKSYTQVQWGRTYLDSVILDLYYSNGVDSGFNLQYPINSTSELDYSLNYQVNTGLYLQGYNLYYRIIVKDKGIVPSYYYKPATGYYKLIYNPSPAQVLFSNDSIYIPTLTDSGSVNIVNTSDHSVRIDSIISVGSFYGYWGNFSKPGFEYPFYLFQTMPGFMGDTLGIIIPPHDSINVSFFNVDLCPFCDYEVQEYFNDTLRFVFTFIDGNVYSFSKSIPISGEGHPSDVKDEDVFPSEFILEQNYPNPFNPSTMISYQLPISGQVTLKVYDVLGNEVATLVNEYRDARKYETEFNVAQESFPAITSGVYFYQLKAGDFVETKKMIYLK